MEYLAANWLPLLISLIVGFVLGWLLIGMPAGRKGAQAQQSASDLSAKLNTANRALEDAKKEADALRLQLAADSKSISAAREMDEQLKGREAEQGQQLATAQATIEQLKGDQSQQMAAAQAEIEQLKSSLTLSNEELADANSKLAGPMRLFEKVAGVPADAVSIDHLTPAKAPAIITGIMGGITTKVSKDVQDLSLIPGIGTVSEGKLYEAGIGTYWEVANMTDEELERIIAPNAAQRVNLNYANVRTTALQKAQETSTVGFIWNARTVDDLEKIPGISGVFESRLYSAGISTYKDLSESTPEQLSEVCRPPSTMLPNYPAWIAKAKELNAQKSSTGAASI